MKIDLNAQAAVKAPVQPEQAARRVQHNQGGATEKVAQQQAVPQPPANPALGSHIDVQA